MIHLTEQSKILFSASPVDFRKQIDGLVSLCQYHLQQQPRSGTLFVFINKSKTMLRILCYDQNGYWLATKRLSKGRYSYGVSKTDNLQSLQAHELMRILKGTLATFQKNV